MALTFIRNITFALCNTGVKKEFKAVEKKYIILSNFLSISNFIFLFFNGILFLLLTDNDLGVIASFGSSFLLAAAIYFNKRGWYLFAKIYMVMVANGCSMVGTIVFSHDSALDYYFISIVIASLFLFSMKEKHWLYLSGALSLSFFIIETTPLQNHLPSLDLMKDKAATNLILLSGFIGMLIIQSGIYIYITEQTEKFLLKKQKIILDTTRQLQMQNDDLETFSIAASHSLQTPIYISSFFLNKIRKSNELLVQENEKDFVMIDNSLAQMDKLVSGLFSYNTIIKIEQSYSTFNAAEELEKLKKMLEKKFNNCSIRIIVADIYIHTNPVLFTIIIQNLVENGLKYNQSAIPEVVIRYERLNLTDRFTVADNGIGIDESNFALIFQPFKRLDNSMYLGNGLGLSGAKRASERINGKLYCSKSSHRGSEFVLELPLL